MSPVSGTTVIAVLGIVITKIVDAFRKFDDARDSKGKAKLPKLTWIVLSWAIGIAICLVWQIDALQGLGASSRLSGVGGQVLTGFLTGAGGSGWHEVLDNLSAGAKAKRPAGTPA